MYHDVVSEVRKISFSDYIPTPLKTLTPLVDKRQVIRSVEYSSKYTHNFPVLEILDDFEAYSVLATI
jgi:hypothetical protein